MSWWIYLEDRAAPPWCSFGVDPAVFVPDFPGDPPCPVPCYPAVDVEPFEAGGTFALGGSSAAELNVTYNYGAVFHLVLPSREGGSAFRDALHEQRAGDVIELLAGAVEKLGTQQYEDYWAPTPGNAGHTLSILLGWARQHHDAVFRVS